MEEAMNNSEEKKEKKPEAGYVEIIQVLETLGFKVISITTKEGVYKMKLIDHITVVLRKNE